MGQTPGDPPQPDAEFLARLDEQAEQAHRNIAAIYHSARRHVVGAHAADPEFG
jgi:hypothetical protein